MGTGDEAFSSCSYVRASGVGLIWSFPKIRGTILGVPVKRIIVFWGLYWGSLILGKYHLPWVEKHGNHDSTSLKFGNWVNSAHLKRMENQIKKANTDGKGFPTDSSAGTILGIAV